MSFYLFPGQNRRKNQGERHGHDCHADNEQDCILERAEKVCVFHQYFEIVQPDKLLVVGVAAPFVQGHLKDVKRGNQHKDDKQYDCRRYTNGNKN